MRKKNPFLFIDIETGGLDLNENPLLSISYKSDLARTKTLFNKPPPGSTIQEWAAENVWKPIQQRLGGIPRRTEEQSLKQFLGVLKAHRGGTLVGWNIGYDPLAQQQGVKGLDVPGLISRATKYGMEEQYQSAISGMKIRDIGREYSVRIAGEVSKYQSLVDPKVFKSAKSFTQLVNTNKGLHRLNTIPEQAAWMGGSGQYQGYEVAGWKLKDVYHSLFGENLAGHHFSEQDVEATARIFRSGDPSLLTGAGYISKLNTTILANKAEASARARLAEGEGKGVAKGFLRAGASAFERFGWAGKVIRENPLALGFAGAALGLYLTKPLSHFSGKDDKYNTLEGLPHGGQAERKRRQHTAFGSGWVGLAIREVIEEAAPRLWVRQKRIEGLRHGGQAQRKRRELTDFGSGWQGNKKKYERRVHERFAFFEKALGKYGQEVGTGHKRILIPKKALTKGQIEGVLGFTPVTIAIPEAGQVQVQSYRNPDNLYHIHDLGEEWSMHKDRDPAATMLLKKWASSDSKNKSILDPIAKIIEGIPHAIEEGIPGAFYYLKGMATGGTSMVTRLKTDLDPHYQAMVGRMKELRDNSPNSFSAKDKIWNTIKGLSPGGLSGKRRGVLTDFDSGWEGDSQTSNESHFGALSGGVGALVGGLLGYRFASKAWGGPGSLRFNKKKYPRLAELRKIGRKHGYTMVAPSLEEQMGNKVWGKVFGKPLKNWKGLKKNRYKGVVYNYEMHPADAGFDPNPPRNTINYNTFAPDWELGADKWKTYQFYELQGKHRMHAETKEIHALYGGEATPDEDFIQLLERVSGAGSPEEARKLGRGIFETKRAKKLIKRWGGTKNVVIKHRRAVMQEGVWMGIENFPDKEIDALITNPENYLIQRRLPLAQEFRAITVAGKTIFSAHRFGNQQTKDALKWLEGHDKNLAAKIMGKHMHENIVPIGDRDIRERLHAFTEKAAKTLPKGTDVTAWDIGLTEAGEFKIIEMQRGFGTIRNPVVMSRIEEMITGRLGRVSKASIGAFAGIGALAAIGVYNLFSGKDDHYNTIEGLSHKGIAKNKRKQHTAFGSGWDALRGLVQHSETFAEMIAGKEFQESLQAAKYIGQLGKGDWGTVSEMAGKFRGQEFSFARKMGQIGPMEAHAQHALSESITPTVYGHSAEHIDMELFHGKTVKQTMAEGDFNIGEHLEMVEKLKAKWGGIHGDLGIHNVMVLEHEGQRRYGLIDFGKATKVPGYDDAWNTVEGLTHQGFAGSERKKNTDFGSGWRWGLRSFIKSFFAKEEGKAAAWTLSATELKSLGKNEYWKLMKSYQQTTVARRTEDFLARKATGNLTDTEVEKLTSFSSDEIGQYFGGKGAQKVGDKYFSAKQVMHENTAFMNWKDPILKPIVEAREASRKAMQVEEAAQVQRIAALKPLGEGNFAVPGMAPAAPSIDKAAWVENHHEAAIMASTNGTYGGKGHRRF